MKLGREERDCRMHRKPWTLIGVCKGTATNHVRVNHIKVNEQQNLDKVVRNFWETEAFGTKVDSDSSLSINDNRILDKLNSETEFKNGHYVAPMLWKS